MTPEFIIGIAKDSIQIALLISMPMLGLGMIVGLIISVFQSVTQIQEMTLTFVPKIIAVMTGLLVFGPWMLTKLTDYASNIMTNFPIYIR